MNKHIITLLLVCSTHASAATPAVGDSTTAGNQSMRVVTFKAVPGTERTYYYHRDHLGSTTLITNESGEVVQRVEYLPTGETFIEQQDTSWVNPHKFNGRSALRDAFFLHCITKASKLERETTWRKKELDKMQARLRPPLIPHFTRDIKDEKRNEGKKGEHVKNVKRLA